MDKPHDVNISFWPASGVSAGALDSGRRLWQGRASDHRGLRRSRLALHVCQLGGHAPGRRWGGSGRILRSSSTTHATVAEAMLGSQEGGAVMDDGGWKARWLLGARTTQGSGRAAGSGAWEPGSLVQRATGRAPSRGGVGAGVRSGGGRDGARAVVVVVVVLAAACGDLVNAPRARSSCTASKSHLRPLELGGGQGCARLACNLQPASPEPRRRPVRHRSSPSLTPAARPPALCPPAPSPFTLHRPTRSPIRVTVTTSRRPSPGSCARHGFCVFPPLATARFEHLTRRATFSPSVLLPRR